MSSFSKKQGYVTGSKIQVESLSEQTRTALWNYLYSQIWEHWQSEPMFSSRNHENQIVELLVKHLWQFIGGSLDSMRPFNPHREGGTYSTIKNTFMQSEWHEAYTMLEYILKYWPEQLGTPKTKAIKYINSTLENYSCPYRFFNDQILPLSDPTEIDSINKGLSSGGNNVSRHLEKAVKLLSDFKKPDYENSIKESISSVEALVQHVTGDEKGTLGAMLKKMDGLHPSFEAGIAKLYGFAGDEAGIRHGTTKDPVMNITQADAKFFLVLCTGFINYINSKIAEGVIKIKK